MDSIPPRSLYQPNSPLEDPATAAASAPRGSEKANPPPVVIKPPGALTTMAKALPLEEATSAPLADRTSQVLASAEQSGAEDDFQAGFVNGQNWLKDGPRRATIEAQVQGLINQGGQSKSAHPDDALPRLFSGFAQGINLGRQKPGFVNQLVRALMAPSIQPPLSRAQLQSCLHALALACAPAERLARRDDSDDSGTRVDYVRGKVWDSLDGLPGQEGEWAQRLEYEFDSICDKPPADYETLAGLPPTPAALPPGGPLAAAWANGARGMHLHPLWTLANPRIDQVEGAGAAPKTEAQASESDAEEHWDTRERAAEGLSEEDLVSLQPHLDAGMGASPTSTGIAPASVASTATVPPFDKQALTKRLEGLKQLARQPHGTLDERLKALRALLPPASEPTPQEQQEDEEELDPRDSQGMLLRLSTLTQRWEGCIEGLLASADGAEDWDDRSADPTVWLLGQDPSVQAHFAREIDGLENTAREYSELMKDDPVTLDTLLEGFLDQVDQVRQGRAVQAKLLQSLREQGGPSVPAREGEPWSTTLVKALWTHQELSSEARRIEIAELHSEYEATPDKAAKRSLWQEIRNLEVERAESATRTAENVEAAWEAGKYALQMPEDQEERPPLQASATAKINHVMRYLGMPMEVIDPQVLSDRSDRGEVPGLNDNPFLTPPGKPSIMGDED